jgi:hypothetical protein
VAFNQSLTLAIRGLHDIEEWPAEGCSIKWWAPDQSFPIPSQFLSRQFFL